MTPRQCKQRVARCKKTLAVLTNARLLSQIEDAGLSLRKSGDVYDAISLVASLMSYPDLRQDFERLIEESETRDCWNGMTHAEFAETYPDLMGVHS